MAVQLPVGSQALPHLVVRRLNAELAVPTWTHGIGRFVEHEEDVTYAMFLPAYLAQDRQLASWLFDEALLTAAITIQEVRAKLYHGGDPVPHEELMTSLRGVPRQG